MARTSRKQSEASRSIGHSPQYGFGVDVSAAPFIPMLTGLNLYREMERMWETDETVGAMDWCIQTTMAKVDWRMIPQVDGKDNDADPQAVKWADWAQTMLEDMAFSMPEHIEEALTMLKFGFAGCEIITKQRDGLNSRYNDKYYGISKLPLRDQHTIVGWQYDTQQNLTAMQQMSWEGSATIPLYKTLHFRTTSVLNRPQGRPMLLNAYRPWRLKNKIQDAEAIGIERDLCGIPMFKIPRAVINAAREVKQDGSPTDEAIEAQAYIRNAQKAVTDMRFNKSGGLVMPSDTFFEETNDGGGGGDRTPMFDFKIMTTAGQRSIDTRTAARDYDRAIARAAMMQFLHLGDRSTGSYAMSDDQSSMAVSSLMAIAMKIAAQWNKTLLPLMWTINNFDPRYMPRLRASDISKDGLQAIAAVLGALGKSGGLWESDADMRIGFSKLINIPFSREAQIEAAGTAQKAAAAAATAPKPTFGASAPAKPGSEDE